MNSKVDVVIIGSGPAGYTAALYLARSNLNPVLFEGSMSEDSQHQQQQQIIPGGLLTTTKIVENFPGFPEGIDGYELTERFKEQAVRFGTRVIDKTVHAVRFDSDSEYPIKIIIKNVSAASASAASASAASLEELLSSKAVIIATGSSPKHLSHVPGYWEFWQNGVSTCAVCDGSLPCFRNVPVAVVGGGDSACEEALHLTHTASLVYLIHRRNELRASAIMADRVLSHPKIKMVWNSEVTAIRGSGSHHEKLALIDIKNTADTAAATTLEVRGLFVAIGHVPNSDVVKGLVELDSDGYIITHGAQDTCIKGVYAAGDVQDRRAYRQAITAAGSGCAAALEVIRYLQ